MSTTAGKTVEKTATRVESRADERRSSSEGRTEDAALALQRSAGNRAVTSLLREQGKVPAPVEHALSKSSGEKLPEGVQENFSRKFGRDLSDVKVHRDSAASEAVHGLGAKAFAYGNRLFFRDGAYRPETSEGKVLLAHELAHVVQQSGGNGSSGASRAASEKNARQASAAQAQGSAGIDAGPAAPVGVAADNGMSYEDEDAKVSRMATKDEVLDKIIDTEDEANKQRSELGVTDANVAKLDEQAMYLRDKFAPPQPPAAKNKNKNRNPNRNRNVKQAPAVPADPAPAMPTSSPDLRDASVDEIRAQRRKFLELQLTVKDQGAQEILAREIENASMAASYAQKTYNIVIDGQGVSGLREHEAAAMLKSMLFELGEDTQSLEGDVERAHKLREETSSWVTGPVHFWGGAWTELEMADFIETNQARLNAAAALKAGDIQKAIDLTRDSYYAYKSVNQRFNEYQEGIQRGAGRMINLLSHVENISKMVVSSWNPAAGAVMSFTADTLQQAEMVHLGQLDSIDLSGNLKGALISYGVGKISSGLGNTIGGAATPYVGNFGGKALGFTTSTLTTAGLTGTNPVDMVTDPDMWIAMFFSHQANKLPKSRGGMSELPGPSPSTPEEPIVPNDPAGKLASPSQEPITKSGGPNAGEPVSTGGTSTTEEPLTTARDASKDEPTAAGAAAPKEEPTAKAAPTDEPATTGGGGSGDKSGSSGGGGGEQGEPTPARDMRGDVMPDGTIKIRGDKTSKRKGGSRRRRGKEKGRSWWVALNVDEPQAVGEPGLTAQEAMRRAKDLTNRQFLDQMTNQGTKGAAVERPSPARSEPDLSPVSVLDHPEALITRPKLGGVKEWDEMSKIILEQNESRLEGKTPKEVKNILNKAIRDEIKNPQTEPGKIISSALAKMFPNIPLDLLFRSRRAPTGATTAATDMRGEAMPDDTIRIRGEDEVSGQPEPREDMRGEVMPDDTIRVRGEDEAGGEPPVDMRGRTMPDGSIRIRGKSGPKAASDQPAPRQDMRGEVMPDDTIRVRGEDEAGGEPPVDMRGRTMPDGSVRIRGKSGPKGGSDKAAPREDMRGEVMPDDTIRVRGEDEVTPAPDEPTDMRGRVMPDGSVRIRGKSGPKGGSKSGSGRGRTRRNQFVKEFNQALQDASVPGHPFRGLLEPDPQTGGLRFRKYTRTAMSTGRKQTGRYAGSDVGPIMQKGHMESLSSGAPQTFALEDADFNTVGGSVIESKGAFARKVSVLVAMPDGTHAVPIELRTLQQLEALGPANGGVPAGTVEAAIKFTLAVRGQKP